MDKTQKFDPNKTVVGGPVDNRTQAMSAPPVAWDLLGSAMSDMFMPAMPSLPGTGAGTSIMLIWPCLAPLRG